MIKIHFIRWVAGLILIIIGNGLYSQTANSTVQTTIPEIALLDVEPTANTSITMTLLSPTEAGNPVILVGNNSNWLNFTSCVTTTGNRKVMAEISGSALPAGVTLTLQASTPSGTGVCGSGATVTLSGASQVIITGVRGCYTGDGTNNGSNLNYSLSYSDFSDLRSGTFSSVLVTFTMVAY